ncbi:MAG: hypothetical protein D3923_16115, partial [Candidatus Electrothrix sp. AR3]|nr:hypothetical protein [Candidatus Electrothrix sp. AR3]
MDDTLANEIVDELLGEVEGYLPQMRACLQTLKKDKEDEGAIAELHRMVHTIKGAAAMVGLNDLSRAGELLEEVMDSVIDSTLIMDDNLISLFAEATQCLDTFCMLQDAEEQKDSNLYKEIFPLFAQRLEPIAIEPDKEVPASEQLSVAIPEEEPSDSIADILDQLLSKDDQQDDAEDFFLLNENLEEDKHKQEEPLSLGDATIAPELNEEQQTTVKDAAEQTNGEDEPIFSDLGEEIASNPLDPPEPPPLSDQVKADIDALFNKEELQEESDEDADVLFTPPLPEQQNTSEDLEKILDKAPEDDEEVDPEQLEYVT